MTQWLGNENLRPGNETWAHQLAVVDPAVVVLDELLDEALVLVQHLLAHVGDVVQYRLVLHQEVLLGAAPGVEPGESLERNHAWTTIGLCYTSHAVFFAAVEKNRSVFFLQPWKKSLIFPTAAKKTVWKAWVRGYTIKFSIHYRKSLSTAVKMPSNLMKRVVFETNSSLPGRYLNPHTPHPEGTILKTYMVPVSSQAFAPLHHVPLPPLPSPSFSLPSPPPPLPLPHLHGWDGGEG